MEIGEKYGDWTVIGKSDKPFYVKCRCKCGTVRDVYMSSLRNHKSESCGCRTKERNRKYGYTHSDERIIGKKFGRLTAIKRINNKGRSDYLCKCDCGNETVVVGASLLYGKIRSCGCMKSEVSSESFKEVCMEGHKIVEKNCVEGTNLLSLTAKLSKANTSGVKGVSFNKRTGKYRAYIYLRGKQKYLGDFSELEDAANARKEAEKKYFKPILDRHKDTLKDGENDKK